MILFISYAQRDLPLAQQLAARLSQGGVKVRYWEQDKVPSKPAWQTIQGWIDESTIVVPILTQEGGISSPAVNQEVGYAVRAGKRIAAIVGPQVAQASLAMIQATTIIALDTVDKILDGVSRAIQAEKDERVKIAMGVLLLAFAAWLIYMIYRSSDRALGPPPNAGALPPAPPAPPAVGP